VLGISSRLEGIAPPLSPLNRAPMSWREAAHVGQTPEQVHQHLDAVASEVHHGPPPDSALHSSHARG
jgi:hypothetical protein